MEMGPLRADDIQAGRVGDGGVRVSCAWRPTLVWVGVLFLLSRPGAAETARVVAPSVLLDAAQALPELTLDMPYARRDNFTGTILYPRARCLLRPAVMKMLAQAQAQLAARVPPLRLIAKDCYRPDSVQRRLWAAVRGTRRRGYVADPDSPMGSVHSYGAAVDVSLADAAGQELDMGTPYDFLGSRAEPRREAEMLAAGVLTAQQIASRVILRTAMQEAGFKSISNEWWHFDAWRSAALRQRYQRLDLPL